MPAIISYAATALAQLVHHVQPILQRGGIVAVPTETFYALGVNPFDGAAVDRLCAVKGRPAGLPILVLVGALGDLALFAEHVSPAASVLMEAFWPGPLTIVFPARASLPPALTGGTQRIGIRVSSCEPLRELLEHVGPLTGTSANRTGAPPACTARDVHAALGEEVDAIIDAGPTPGGLPSTVIEADDVLRLVRVGAITEDALEAALSARGFSLKRAQM
jgi:L-threonylcarbamoyladenylate synthase